MFKLESYITPIILSQVERYVKNIKAEDSQVSLWGGDAVFNNLDLRLDVLEDELHLPFSLVSGHIHELQIHVPWTRLNAEPIVLTINTIECVLKLPSDRASSVSSSDDTTVSGEDKTEEKRKGKRKKEEQTAPPGYIQGLINKIISNISIVCNNLILKYVEDDLVLSLNVRNVSYVSCDDTWKPAFTELSLQDLIKRKLLSVSDLTICLDRRGTTGKIELYQDPLLYRCSMTARLSWCYASLNSKLPFRTVINLLADKMDFSMTGVQVPMVVRLFKLFLAFYYGDILSKQEQERRKSRTIVVGGGVGEPDLAQDVDPDSSLGSLLWDVGSSIGTALLPVYWEDEDSPEDRSSASGAPALASSGLGVYCKEASLTLKLAASVKQKGFYRGGKQCFNSYLVCSLQGLYSEVNTKANNWVNVQAGVSQLLVSPVGAPSEVVEHYIVSGAEGNKFLDNSLFAPEFGSEETPMARELRDLKVPCWETHMERTTEAALLERSPALGMDYVYHVDLPSEGQSDSLSELETDLEHSNLPERALCRLVLGPATLNLTLGAVSRVRTVMDLIQDYDYVPYVEPRPDPGPEKLSLPSREEVESLEKNSPVRVYRLTVFHPSLVVHGKQHQTLQLGLSSLVAVHQTPMYPLRNVKTGCVMHPPSKVILNNCHHNNSLDLNNVWLKLNFEKESVRILTADRVSLNQRNLLYQQFWKNIYQKQCESSVKVDSCQINISLPQLVMVSQLIDHVRSVSSSPEIQDLLDHCRDPDQPLICCVVSNLSFSLTQTRELLTSLLAIDSLSVSLKGPTNTKPVPIFNGLSQKSNRNINVSHPGQSPGKALPDESSSKWLILGLQWPIVPLQHEAPTMFRFFLGETFLLFEPKLSRVVKFATLYSSQKKPSLRGLDRESIKSEEKGLKLKTEPRKEISFFQCLTGTVVDVKLGSFCLYFCDKSLSEVSGQSVSDVVIRAARAKREYNMINVQLASGEVHNVSCRVDLSQYTQFPVLFPPAVWTSGKDNFPWVISLNGFFIGRINETNFTEILKPVKTSCTFGSSSVGSSGARNLAVHVDMTPVEFYLDSLVMSSVAMVTQSLVTLALDTLPEVSEDESSVRIFPPSPGQVLVQRSLGSASVSESATQLTGSVVTGAMEGDSSSQDWSLWLQWAIPQTSFTLLSGKRGEQSKLVILLEDSSISVDKQSTYTKIKSRIRSVTGQHLLESSQGFQPRSFPGQIISSQPDLLKTLFVFNPETGSVEVLSDDDDGVNQSKGVFNMTITKAECQNLMKKLKSSKGKAFDPSNQPKRYLSEFDIEVNPVDIFLETSILEAALSVLYPLAMLKLPKSEKSMRSSGDLLLKFSNNNLPLVYLKSERIRIFTHIPRSKMSKYVFSDGDNDLLPDFILFQLNKASITSQVENPLTRILVDPSLFHQASNSKLLGVPGSPVEDRQYQLDVVGVSLATGHWQDVRDKNTRPAKPLLRTMSENPALEWNTNIQKMEDSNDVVLVPLFYDLRVKLLVAPAIVYQKFLNEAVHETLVAGVSSEVNLMSDINISASLQQLSFFTIMKEEINSFFIKESRQEKMKERRSTVKSADSGLESIREDESFKSVDNTFHLDTVPLELLLTCTNVRVSLHKYEKSSASVTEEDLRLWRRYHHAKRKLTEVYENRNLTKSDDSAEDDDDRDRNERNVLLDLTRTTENMSTTGYEGSDDESIVETQTELKIRLVPFFSLTVVQPYIALCISSSSQKMDFSVYNIGLALSPQGFHLPAKSGKKVPWLRDFPLTLLETKPGRAESQNEISPAFLSLTLSDIMSKYMALDCRIARPVLMSLSEERYRQIKMIASQVESYLSTSTSPNVKQEAETGTTSWVSLIRDVEVKTVQMMCRYDCREKDLPTSVRTNIGGSGIKLHLDQRSKHLAVEGKVDLERTSVSFLLNNIPHNLIGPFNIQISGSKTFLSQNFARNANIKIQINQVNIHLGPNHLYAMEKVQKNLADIFGESSQEEAEADAPRVDSDLLTDSELEKESEEELNFQDDLRAGAFQFLEATGQDPSPYQAVFGGSTLTWKYPQRRTLSKVVIFPLPFLDASDVSCEVEDGVDCELLYLSDTLGHFVVYQQFQLSESKMVHLDLPLIRDRKLCCSSTTWQVRLNTEADKAHIAPKSLLSVLKVDSFASPRLQPESQLSVAVTTLKLILHNQLHFAGKKLEGELSDLALDQQYPLDTPFLSLTCSPLSCGVSVWSEDRAGHLLQYSFKSKLAVEYVDFAFLGNHHFVKPSDIDLWVQQQNGQLDVSGRTGPVNASLGPFLIHTLRQSARLWSQVGRRLGMGLTEEDTFVPLCQFLVVNETGQVLRFGQAGTEEQVVVQPKHCSMYAWRTNKASQKLRVGTGSDLWSGSFSVESPGEQIVNIVTQAKEKSSSVLVAVERKSSTYTIVKFCGLLNILNLLKDHLELRIVPGSSKEVRCLIASYCRPTSVLSDCGGDTVLKIRLFGLATPWSGDIPLEALVGKRKSFMVKLPLKDKIGSMTIWCTILTEKLEDEVRKLIIFSPMYVINSQLPGRITAVIDNNEKLKDISVEGYGATEQLDVTAAPENKFGMSFRMDPSLPPSSPPLTVSWGIVDQVRDKNAPLISINEAIKTSHQYNLKSKKSSAAMETISRMKVSEQPKTDCKVRFGQYHPATNTLCVKLQPHFLIVNTTSLALLTKIQDQSTWIVEPSSVFQPAPVDNRKFYLGLLDDVGSESWGSPLELSDSDWTYLSIRPSIQGIIHLHGTMMYKMKSSQSSSAFITLVSDVVEGIRVLTIKPTFVVNNQVESPLCIKPILSTSETSGNDESVKTTMMEEAICPLYYWFSSEQQPSNNIPHLVRLSGDSVHWSSELTVPLDEDTRRCVTVPSPSEDTANIPIILMTQRAESQVFIVVRQDERPQIKLHNLLTEKIIFKEEGSKSYEEVSSQQSLFLTMPWLSGGFPYIEQHKQSKKLQFSLENNAWSAGVDVTVTQETFIRLPGLGDVRLTVECLQPTGHVYIEPVSHLEVAARDIRARFESPPTTPLSPLSPASTVYVSPNTTYSSLPSPDIEKFSDCLLYGEDMKKTSSRRPSTSSSFSVIGKPVKKTGHFISVKCSELSFAITDDLCFEDDFQEIIRMTLSNIEVLCRPRTDYSTLFKTLGGQNAEDLDVSVKISDFQVDNQMFKRGLYHFPVLLCGQDHSRGGDQTFSLIEMDFIFSTCEESVYTKDFHLKCQPMSVNFEDILFYKLQEYANIFLQPVDGTQTLAEPTEIPQSVIYSCASASQLIYFNKITIEEMNLRVSVHASLKVYVGLEDSMINLSKFENSAVWSTWYSLGHRLSMHYLSGALFKAGWVVGSLDMIGSPAAFTRNVTDGVKDFVSLPFNGIWHGPWGFVVGLSQGSSSLVKHVSAGTLTSITNFASSMSRNLDRLSFDEEHLLRNEEVRRLKPQGIGEGLLNGLSGVGISLLGAVGGLAHHPIQVLLEEGVSPVKLIGGVGRGMVGVVTKPLGSAAELIAQTGQGMLSGTGWTRSRRPRLHSLPALVLDLSSSSLKYQWKVLQDSEVAAVLEASLLEEDQYHAVSVILTRDGVHIVNEEEDEIREMFSLEEIKMIEPSTDPTLLILQLQTRDLKEKYRHVNDRVARFVLESISYAEHGVSPELRSSAENSEETRKILLYLSPNKRTEFCTFYTQIKEEYEKVCFPVLF